ncbi:MAG TPA: PIG-L deacetylase family protein [Ktedonobacterales bacterium]|nr:PIG-L deacetylase family protein [Ktedonobacterales bacterium]
MSDSQQAIPDTRPRVMVIMAHPDDAEFTSGGTVARFAASGYRVQYVLATSGDKGSADHDADPAQLARTRQAEQREAARVLDVAEVTFLGHKDGEVEVSLALRAELALVIRQGRPDVVLTFDPWQRYQIHPDHRAVGQTALDAVVAARDHLYFAEQLGEGLTEHRAHNIYFFASDQPNYYVDISSTLDQKIAALQCHRSQLGDRPIAEMMRARAATVGQEVGLAAAEAFHYLPMMRPPELKRLPDW